MEMASLFICCLVFIACVIILSYFFFFSVSDEGKRRRKRRDKEVDQPVACTNCSAPCESRLLASHQKKKEKKEGEKAEEEEKCKYQGWNFTLTLSSFFSFFFLSFSSPNLSFFVVDSTGWHGSSPLNMMLCPPCRR
jgi:hypothetical protein